MEILDDAKGAAKAVKVAQLLDQIGDPKIVEITRIHAGIAAGLAFIPIPGVSVAASLANVYTMFGRINSALDIRFSDNVLKSVGGMLAANVGSTVAGVAACEVIKFIPLFGSITGAMAEAAIYFGTTKVQGALYCEWLKAMCKQGAIGNDGAVDAEAAKKAMSDVCENSDIKQMVADAKKEAKSVDLKKYRDEAARLAKEQQDHANGSSRG